MGRFLFVPRVMGIFILLIIIIAFAAGAVRQEAALTLAGAVFLLPWAYCLIMTPILALLHSRRARRAFIRVSLRETAAGGQSQAIYHEGDAAFTGKIFELPGILVRCRLLLETKDGRRIRHDFNPRLYKGDDAASHFFTAEKRGAYFSAYDEFNVFDSLGFFRLTFRLPVEKDARLLASPRRADEPPEVRARAGDSDLQPEFSFQRTDDLIDHRPYVPGDDPRRINWKLYSHGGGLFVREGEYEPPPHSNILILVDTEYDPSLYSPGEARDGIDLLCENALAAALACKDSGMDVLVGFGAETAVGAANTCGGGTAKELASALAWPAAMPRGTAVLPAPPDERGVLILALPRSLSDTALDRFLTNTAGLFSGKSRPRQIEIIFLCGGSAENVKPQRLVAAETCAALYNRRPDVKAGICR